MITKRYLKQPIILGIKRKTFLVCNIYLYKSVALKQMQSCHYSCINSDIINMLRITNLMRGKLLKRIPMRAGIPNWDRPDPPPTVHVPLDHQLTDTQIIFEFRDGGEPEFFLTQPEVYEGDTLIEAAPALLKGWAFFLGIAGVMGFILYFSNPLKDTKYVGELRLSLLEREKQAIKNKQWLKWATQNNPIGLKPTNDTFPFARTQLSRSNKFAQSQHMPYSKSDAQLKAYLTALKAKAAQIVKDRKAKHNSHQHGESHQAHHSHQTHAVATEQAHHSGEAHVEHSQAEQKHS